MNEAPRSLSPEPAALSLGAGRIDAVDAARGFALLAMIFYHFCWDLSFLQLIVTQVASDPAWKWFARSIAGSFLFLVGVSLVLGHGDRIRWRPFLKRLAMIGAAAGAITLVTRLVFPESYIFFGILHCIAVASVLALPFLRLPWPAVLGTGIAVTAGGAFAHLEAFNAPALVWLGLGTRVPFTNDYVPVFPWFGFVLLGVAAARAFRPVLAGTTLRRWRAQGGIGRTLAGAGRRSLVIYLVHQPLLLAVLYPMAQILGPNPAAEAAPFMQDCEGQCRRSSREPDQCRLACACAVERLKTNDLWKRVVRGELTLDERERAQSLARQCF